MSTSRTLPVVGMTCEHCVRAVESEVGAIEGVDDVNVDLAAGEVTVTASRDIATEELVAAIDEAGFEIGS